MNEQSNDIMLIIKNPEGSGLLIKGVSETSKRTNEAKEQRCGFLCMLLGTLGASLLGNMLADKGVIRAGDGAIATSKGRGTIRAGECKIRAGQDF